MIIPTFLQKPLKKVELFDALSLHLKHEVKKVSVDEEKWGCESDSNLCR